MKISEFNNETLPREKMQKFGSSYLSDEELISVILGTGIKGKGIKLLSREIVSCLDQNQENISLETLMKINGLGLAKASVLLAAFEFARRKIKPSIKKIKFPKDVLPALNHYADRPQEYFICISLNGAHEIQSTRVVSIGLVNKTMVHPREVFADPIKERAAGIICAHNHPSGNTEPSNEDKDVTKMLLKAGQLLGIEVLDHIIFSQKGYYSFAENNEL